MDILTPILVIIVLAVVVLALLANRNGWLDAPIQPGDENVIEEGGDE